MHARRIALHDRETRTHRTGGSSRLSLNASRTTPLRSQGRREKTNTADRWKELRCPGVLPRAWIKRRLVRAPKPERIADARPVDPLELLILNEHRTTRTVVASHYQPSKHCVASVRSLGYHYANRRPPAYGTRSSWRSQHRSPRVLARSRH